ncbi:hypothetical protein HK099_004484 [Clydaea vesicula]|uniref:Uncharacterized protein n=1 Tax=Clydaea vesicula TaxID=447962 RepID=A0AAD5U3L3_9FUNG|nr:hypothetical protein HK099_004484 [Clydaea vesicula]
MFFIPSTRSTSINNERQSFLRLKSSKTYCNSERNCEPKLLSICRNELNEHLSSSLKNSTRLVQDLRDQIRIMGKVIAEERRFHRTEDERKILGMQYYLKKKEKLNKILGKCGQLSQTEVVITCDNQSPIPLLEDKVKTTLQIKSLENDLAREKRRNRAKNNKKPATESDTDTQLNLDLYKTNEILAVKQVKVVKASREPLVAKIAIPTFTSLDLPLNLLNSNLHSTGFNNKNFNNLKNELEKTTKPILNAKNSEFYEKVIKKNVQNIVDINSKEVQKLSNCDWYLGNEENFRNYVDIIDTTGWLNLNLTYKVGLRRKRVINEISKSIK